MPYLILAAGLLIGAFALYKFFLTASVEEVKSFFSGASLVALALLLIIMSLTGKLPAALVLLILFFPYIWKIVRRRIKGDAASPSSDAMTRAEALKILDLNESASEDDIQDAYKRLMQKVHPDNQGSDWMAAKLNQARDLLLKS